MSDLLMNLEFEHKTNSDAIIKALALFNYYMKRNTIIACEDRLYAKDQSLIETQSGDVKLIDSDVTRHKLFTLYFDGKNIKNIYAHL